MVLTVPDQTRPNGKLAEREGFERSPPAPPSIYGKTVYESREAQSSPLASPNVGQLWAELATVVSAWGALDPASRAAVLAIVASAEGGRAA